MILKYGTFTHVANSVSLVIDRQVWRDDTGRRRGFIETWTLAGRLLATGADLVGNLTTQINALIAAYDVDEQDLTLFESDGTTPTAHILDTSASTGGTRVLSGPSFPSGTGAEYATFRDYTIVVEAKFQDSTEETLSFTETISVTGTGGKRFVMLPVLRGRPVKQTVLERTPVMLTQSGTAVGRTAYPRPPDPISRQDERVDQRQIIRQSPKRDANGDLTEFEISWRYVFERAAKFSRRATTPNTFI